MRTIISFSAFTLALAVPAFLRGDSNEQVKPVINAATVDLATNQIAIEGVNFGVNTPTIVLDFVSLRVLTFTDKLAVASLPPNPPAGSFALSLTRGSEPRN